MLNQAIAGNIMAVAREITHIEASKGKMPLSLGIRTSSIDIQAKVKAKGDQNSDTLDF